MFCSDWYFNEILHIIFINGVYIHVHFTDHGTLKAIVLDILYSEALSIFFLAAAIWPSLNTLN